MIYKSSINFVLMSINISKYVVTRGILKSPAYISSVRLK